MESGGPDADEDPTNGRHDAVKTSYDWFVGDTRLDENGPTLDLSAPGNGDRGDVITVRVTAYDGVDTTVKSDQVVVEDSATHGGPLRTGRGRGRSQRPARARSTS